MGRESFDVVRFDLGPLLQGQTRISKLKSAYSSLIFGPRGPLVEVCNVRFDLWPFLQGHMRIAKIKSAYNSLLLVSRSLQCHTNL